jgi:cytochrome b561
MQLRQLCTAKFGMPLHKGSEFAGIYLDACVHPIEFDTLHRKAKFERCRPIVSRAHWVRRIALKSRHPVSESRLSVLGGAAMAAQAQLSLHPSRNPYSHIRQYAPDACMALLVVVIGAAGLVAHSWARQIVESWINIHVLFALLLCGWVIVRHQLHVKQYPRMLPRDVRELTRQQSRIVYWVLYSVLGLKLIISIVSSVWHGDRVSFSLFDRSILNGPDSKVFDPRDDFQLFLASGVLALVVVRIMALRLWLRLTEHART